MEEPCKDLLERYVGLVTQIQKLVNEAALVQVDLERSLRKLPERENLPFLLKRLRRPVNGALSELQDPTFLSGLLRHVSGEDQEMARSGMHVLIGLHTSLQAFHAWLGAAESNEITRTRRAHVALNGMVRLAAALDSVCKTQDLASVLQKRLGNAPDNSDRFRGVKAKRGVVNGQAR